MALPVYLAMTGAEVAGERELPPHMAWMACHFSSYGPGLSNCPKSLPPGSMLILNDRIPVQDHDPELVARQLAQWAQMLEAACVLLDLQRPENPQTAAIVQKITDTLTCPVAATESYAGHDRCALFLDAPRAYQPLRSLADRHPGRQLWLEVTPGCGTVTVTGAGSRYEADTPFPPGLPVHRDERLHCSYCILKSDTQVQFHFRRTQEDLAALLEEAEALGITHAVGLYQELAPTFHQESSNSKFIEMTLDND